MSSLLKSNGGNVIAMALARNACLRTSSIPIYQSSRSRSRTDEIKNPYSTSTSTTTSTSIPIPPASSSSSSSSSIPSCNQPPEPSSYSIESPITLHPPTHGYHVASLHLRSYGPLLANLDFFSQFALRTASVLNIPTSGIVSLPTRVSLWTVPKGPFVHKKSQENFQRRTHKRLIKVWDADPQVIDRWLTFLRIHALEGVGMRVELFSYHPIDYSTKMLSNAQSQRRSSPSIDPPSSSPSSSSSTSSWAPESTQESSSTISGTEHASSSSSNPTETSSSSSSISQTPSPSPHKENESLPLSSAEKVKELAEGILKDEMKDLDQDQDRDQDQDQDRDQDQDQDQDQSQAQAQAHGKEEKVSGVEKEGEVQDEGEKADEPEPKVAKE